MGSFFFFFVFLGEENMGFCSYSKIILNVGMVIVGRGCYGG